MGENRIGMDVRFAVALRKAMSLRGQSGGHGCPLRGRLAKWSGAIDSCRVGSPRSASRMQRLRYGRDSRRDGTFFQFRPAETDAERWLSSAAPKRLDCPQSGRETCGTRCVLD
jgi:hypothetical protein